MFPAIAASLLLPVLAGFGSSADARPERVPDEMLVTCREGRTDAECRAALEASGRKILRRFRFAADPGAIHNRRYLVRKPATAYLEQALESVRRMPEIEAAQPNHLYRPLQPPDDPYYFLQWGQENTGDDSAHTLLYAFAGTELLDTDTWVTVYQGAFAEDSWQLYRLPAGEDWLARFGYSPTITRIVFVNDRDTDPSARVYFDFIADITEVVITGLNPEGTMLVVEWWTPGRGLQRLERE